LSRSSTFATSLAIAAALAVAAALSLAVLRTSLGGATVGQAEGALALALEGARWRVEAQLGELRRNAFLEASLEEGDDGAVRAALASACGAFDCVVFDGEGDVVATSPAPQAADAPAATAGPAPSTPDPLSAELRTAAEKGVVWGVDPRQASRLFALTPLGVDAEQLGYVRLELRIDEALLARAAAAAQATLLVGRGVRAQAASTDSRMDRETAAKLDAPLPREARLLGLPRQLPAAFGELRFHMIPPPSRSTGLSVLVALCAAALAGVLPLSIYEHRRARREREIQGRMRQALTSLAESEMLAPLDAAAWPPAARPLVLAVNALVARALGAIGGAETARLSLEQRIERISELLQIEDGAFAAFLDKVEASGTVCQRLVAHRAAEPAAARAQLGAILRALHTIKSSARLLGLSQVHGAARDAEEATARLLRSEAPSAEGLEALDSQLQLVVQETHAYRSIRARILGETRDGRAEALWAQLSWLNSCLARTFGALRAGRLEPGLLGQLYDEYRRAVASMGKEDLAAYVRRYDAMLRDLAGRAGKKLAPLALTGNGRFFDREVMRKLDDVLLHALRNALDHGVEAPLRRKAVGKPEVASIAIESYVIDRIATVVVRDDGRGLDRRELIAALSERGLAGRSELEALTDAELYDKLFANGVTTRSEAGELSGRGVGLDVLREIVRGLGGEARIAPRPDAGTEVVIHFPVDEATASERLSVVSLGREMQDVVTSMQLSLSAADTRVELPSDADDALVTVDRVVFRAAIERLLLTLASKLPKPLVIDAAVALASHSKNGLDTCTLRLTPRGALGPTPIDDAAEELLLEAGMALLPTPSDGGVDLLVPSGVTSLIAPWGITVVSLAASACAAATTFRAVASRCFRAVPLELATATPKAPDPHRIVIAVIDEEQLDATQEAETADVVVVICREIGALRWDRLARVAPDPILAQGDVDDAIAREALEAALLIAVRRAIESLSTSLARAA
jgi:HPt (histidine-containing phosphotransfer) domain-containing protein